MSPPALDRVDEARERISISPDGRLWAIKHAGSYLGYSTSPEEAVRIGRHLADWFIGQGRAADVVVDGVDGAKYLPSPLAGPLRYGVRPGR